MEKRPIGSLSVSVVGLGCNNLGRKLDAAQSSEVVMAAIDAGVNFFDTSDRYGYGDHPYSAVGRSEEFLGAAVRHCRDKVVIATKFGNPMSDDPGDRGGSRRYMFKACEASLKRLGTDYIDLYQIHNPDPDTPVEETLGALSELVAAGKVREAGCSNFTGPLLDEATAVSKEHGYVRFASVQNEFSVLVRVAERITLPACQRHGIAFLPYFPLASGLLTGKYSAGRIPDGTRLAFWKPRKHFGINPELLQHLDSLTRIAADSGHSLLELAMSWLVGRDGLTSVIAGATSPQQVRTNVEAASWTIPPDVLARIDELGEIEPLGKSE